MSAELHWYHTLELPGGELTPGWFDTRAAVDRVPWPGASLHGLRCLDVGTWDGFWAFEMERRGADEVVAIDVPDPGGWDWPARATPTGMEMLGVMKGEDRAFDVAARALRSRVRREDLSVYALDPERLGRFDLVFLGSLLLHLRDPVGALERVRAVCRGTLVLAETVELVASLRWPRRPVARLEGDDAPWWWQPNVATVRRMVRAAGFRAVAATGLYFVPLGPAHPRPPLREGWREARTPAGRERLVAALAGRAAHRAAVGTVGRVRPQRVPVTERTLVRRSYDCFNRRDPEAAFPLYTDDCCWSFRHFSGWPDEQEYRGHAGLVRLFGDFLTAWGEFAIHPTGLWLLGEDRWLIRCHMEATGASSGVPLEADFWQLGTTRDRRIHTVDNYTDDDEVLADAGATADDL